MDHLRQFLAQILTTALTEVRKKRIPVHTFALYHDHESRAVSVCVDTDANSRRVVADINRYNMKYFTEAVARGDLEDAALWQANVGRNLSLGDFALVNVARTDLGGIRVSKRFYVTMMTSLMERQREVVALALSDEALLFCCSGPSDEVAYVWSAMDRAARPNPAMKRTGSARRLSR
jgi:hypothetical protein